MGCEQDFTEITIPTTWGHVSVKTWGDKNGNIPVLGLHGWTDNAGSFDRLAPLLPKSLYFVIVDLPGHGMSSHHPEGLLPNSPDLMLMIKRLVTLHFKWTKFSIIGHSRGAYEGIMYSSLFPNDVIVYVLDDTHLIDTHLSIVTCVEGSKINSNSNLNYGELISVKMFGPPFMFTMVHLISLDIIKPIERACGGVTETLSLGITLGLSQDSTDFSTKCKVFSYEEALRLQRRFYNDSLTEESAKIIMKRDCRQVKPSEYIFTRDVRFLIAGLTMSQFWCRGDTLDAIKRLKCRFLILKGKEELFMEPEETNAEALEIYKNSCSYFEYHLVEGNHYFYLNCPEEAASLINSS